ncbi:LamG-like jellyroll fold domain-containing protein [Streptomyces jumonjinensis]|uniref:LamG-like jellyroll fold domain-containing protein n=1 Tax=Streptomyces jumonjinensis TaxID=1945 RepID=UPI0037AC3DDC
MRTGWGLRAAAMVSSGAVVAGVLLPTTVPGIARSAAAAQAADDGTAGAGRAAPGSRTAVTEAEAVALAKRTGGPVEIVSLRTERSDVFATPDGALEAREYLRPVRARVDGVWKPVDTALVRKGGAVTPGATTVGMEFSGGGGGPLVKLSKAGRDLALTWPEPLPVPQLHGSTAVYPEILPGVDLRLGAQQDGFTQLLVVKSAEAAANSKLTEMRLRLDAHGMDVRETAGGGLEAVDQSAGGTVFEAAQPLMWDSSPGPGAARSGQGRFSATPEQQAGPSGGKGPTPAAAGEPGATESGKLAPVGVDVPADQSALVLRPDPAVLKGPDTVYPVFIDPQFSTPKAAAWTVASKYWAGSPQWKFNGDPDAGLGYCGWQYCKPHDTKRLFYRIPVTKFGGKKIIKAEFTVRNTWSASCGARGVELWRTKDISDRTTWNSQNEPGFWIDHLKTQSFAYGFEGCRENDAEFDVKSAVQQAANKKSDVMVFGLRADNETDVYAWKRFSDEAFLRVKYNRPPPQVKMSQLSMQYGGTCKKPADARRSRSPGTIYANNVTDPDGDQVKVEFRAFWDGGSWNSTTTHRKSGSDFSINLPTSIPPNKLIGWQVRVHERYDTGDKPSDYPPSPWSSTGDATACYFIFDDKAPKSPAIESAEYPATDDANPDEPWLDGMGQYGSFEIRANDSQVTKYTWGLNVDPVPSHDISTTGGAPRTLKMLPAKAGLNTLYVSSFDAAGNPSAPTAHRFRVKAGQLEHAQWALDDISSATEAAGSAPEFPAAMVGGPVVGEPGALGTAVAFDGVDDHARSDLPAVSTDIGFSVSAWAKPSRTPDGAGVVVAQAGNHVSGFELYYSKAYDRWVFGQYAADGPTAGPIRAMAPQAGGVAIGEWTHLVGTYSSTTKELSLYINGVLAGKAPHTTSWDARRGLHIGAGSYGGSLKSFFPGAVDEVQVFDKPVTASEVTRLHGKQSLNTGRPARVVLPMDETAPALHLKGAPQVPAATFQGGAVPGEAGVAGKALTVDGVDDYATTGQPMVNNQRSFTVAAWAKMPETKPADNGVVAGQSGVHRPGFELYYSTAYDRWIFSTHSADSPEGTPIRALQKDSPYGGEWTHLVGVFDTVTMEITLYVNGVKQDSAKLAGDWYAGGPFQIGASRHLGQATSYFAGQIDDVRLLDRPVSAGEVQQMFKQRAVVKARWIFEPPKPTTPPTPAPTTVPDKTGRRHTMSLRGGPTLGSGFADGTLILDGRDDYAEVPVPVDTSASFTITGYARASSAPTKTLTFLRAPGTKRNAVAVQLVPGATPGVDPGRWRLTTVSRDDTTHEAKATEVDNALVPYPDEWTHLAVVYDGFAKQISLYVNGQLQEFACADDDSDGEPDTPACENNVSWSEDVLMFSAKQPFQFGRSLTGAAKSDHWSGELADVWAFQGTLTEAQVGLLQGGQPGLPTQVPGSD